MYKLIFLFNFLFICLFNLFNSRSHLNHFHRFRIRKFVITKLRNLPKFFDIEILLFKTVKIASIFDILDNKIWNQQVAL